MAASGALSEYQVRLFPLELAFLWYGKQGHASPTQNAVRLISESTTLQFIIIPADLTSAVIVGL